VRFLALTAELTAYLFSRVYPAGRAVASTARCAPPFTASEGIARYASDPSWANVVHKSAGASEQAQRLCKRAEGRPAHLLLRRSRSGRAGLS
jgi:hypothetical protein